MKLTKAETEILERVKLCNDRNALAGLGASPDSKDILDRKYRFVKRLWASGAIVWVAYSSEYGAGWALPDLAEKFK